MSSVELVASPAPAIPVLETAALQDAILQQLRYAVGTTLDEALPRDLFEATSLAVRQLTTDRMLATSQRFTEQGAKRVYYLSMEFLIGRSLENNLINLGILDQCREALRNLGVDLELLVESEPDAGLGNGGLGRLAACCIDSLATLGHAGYGYGINYEYGLFKQAIVNGEQREKPDNWLTYGTPWQMERANEAVIVPLYGKVDFVEDRAGEFQPVWTDWLAVVGVPHDMPVVGYGGETVNYLRLFAARGSNEFDMDVFNEGDYLQAVEQKVRAETISKVLYPSDAVASGKELRLVQEYFLVACSVRDLIRRHELLFGDVETLAKHAAVQLNDTHAALTVAELMRLLLDEKELPWDEAWRITQATLAYTNHTLLPEALEKWSVSVLERVLPRHLQIIFEINRRFLADVEKRWPGDVGKLQRMSIIEEGNEKQVRMCHLAIAGSHSVNGVAKLHTGLITTSLVPDFAEMWPERFNNKTNGITQRRWLLQANPRFSRLITDAIGDGWVTDLERLRDLEPLAHDPSFQQAFLDVKLANKQQLARIVDEDTNTLVDPKSMFDVQVKRIHEYKRQLLNALRIIHDFFAITQDGVVPASPRTYVFSGKAAPGYWAAKQIIGLICSLGRVINSHPHASKWMKVVYLPNYRVSLAERIFPASDLSEQISTAGFEASGTGNMKFALNGALTIGTLDGANVEIREEVGDENIFIFGLNVDDIHDIQHQGGYRPLDYYHGDEDVRRVVDALQSPSFWSGQRNKYHWLIEQLLSENETFYHLADLRSYIDAQQRVGETFAHPAAWARKAILNVARMGRFSSDRTVRQYAQQIWGC